MRKKRILRCEIAAAVLFVAFLALILLLTTVDVGTVDIRAVAPDGTIIGTETAPLGLSSLNQSLRAPYTPVWYTLTKLLGYASMALAACFALLGAYQLFSSRSLKKVDPDLYALAGAYALAAVFYVLFEVFVINYRPVILDEGLEASFPSSHTMLILTILGAAAVQCRLRLKNKALRRAVRAVFFVLMALMAVGRLLSGVHWFTDILGGALLGLAIACAYSACADTLLMRRRANRRKAARPRA